MSPTKLRVYVTLMGISAFIFIGHVGYGIKNFQNPFLDYYYMRCASWAKNESTFRYKLGEENALEYAALSDVFLNEAAKVGKYDIDYYKEQLGRYRRIINIDSNIGAVEMAMRKHAAENNEEMCINYAVEILEN